MDWHSILSVCSLADHVSLPPERKPHEILALAVLLAAESLGPDPVLAFNNGGENRVWRKLDSEPDIWLP